MLVNQNNTNLKSIGNDMFLLFTSLARLKDPQRLISVFIEAINSYSDSFSVDFYDTDQASEKELVCLGTSKMTFGYLILNGDAKSCSPEFPALFQNGVQMLAVLLEKLYLDKIIANEKLTLEKQVGLTEKSLLDSDERYRLVMQAVNDGFFDFDVIADKVLYSDRWYTMLGYEPGEFPSTYEAWKGLLPPEEADGIERGLWEVMSSQERWEYEFQMLRKDGGWSWILSRGQVVEKDEAGNPIRIVGTHTDITARKNAEVELIEYREHLEEIVKERTEELESLNERYDTTMNATGTAVWEWNPQTDVSKTNDCWFTVLGFEKDDAQRAYKSWVENIYPDDRDWVNQSLQDHLNGNTDQWQIEHRFNHSKKGLVWLHTIGKVVERDSDGRGLRVIGITSDITDRKNIERELSLKNEELAKTFEDLKSTQSQLILFEKMAALRHLVAGIAHEINTPLGAISSSREIIVSNLKNSIGAIPRLAGWLNGPYGDNVRNIIESSFEYNVDNILMSSRKKREKRYKLILILEEAGVLDAENIGHKLIELRLFSDIEPLLPMLKSEYGYEILCDTAKVIDSILACETIQTAVSKASKIVLALNNYIRRDKDSASGDSKEKVDIRMSLDNVLILFHNAIKNSVSLSVVYDEVVPEIYGSCDELNQVWTNVIQNALQAMGEGGSLEISVKADNEGVVVDISDNGCGMKPDVKKKIFEPLFTTKPAGEGTGLGMDIVRKIVVDNHNGRINVESECGKGTTVSVWLPKGK